MNTRNEVIEILRESGVFFTGIENDIQRFIDGDTDIQLTSLVIDSLSTMEICIMLEDKFGVSITPKEFSEFTHLSKVASMVPTHD